VHSSCDLGRHPHPKAMGVHSNQGFDCDFGCTGRGPWTWLGVIGTISVGWGALGGDDGVNQRRRGGDD